MNDKAKRIIKAFIPPLNRKQLKQIEINEMVKKVENDIYIYYNNSNNKKINSYILYSIIKSKYNELTWGRFIRAYNKIKKSLK